ncbi:MAG: tRNA epoxyqueuosine(34) reductase QueG [Candidatus Rokuibacteriota bacterium]
MSLTALALASAIKARAAELGFSKVAIGPAAPPEHGAAFDRWLEAGYAGTMAYLARGHDDRLDPQRLLGGARSTVALALSHGAGREDDATWTPVARYARGRDYHVVMRPRLQALAGFIVEAAGVGTATRVAVDTSAVLERDLAAQAGLGWIGKNTNLLAPSLGSYFLIGIILTTAEIAPDARLTDRCGTCTACLDACPTGAFVAPYVLDARRCISYLTIEHRGDIAEELRGALHGWLFGCDVCQEVCPWNRKATAPPDPALVPSRSLGEVEDLLGLDAEGFRERFRGSAVRRSKRSGLLRNAVLALAGRRGAESRLRQAAQDADEVVQRAARWALARPR